MNLRYPVSSRFEGSREARMRHQRGFSRDAEFGDELPTGGIYQWRRRGELHKWNPSTIAFLQRYVPKGKSPMCGNSICQDRRFLAKDMPALEAFFHYRNLDVSTLKELARRWKPAALEGFKKAQAHTALADIHESIDELIHYRTHLLAV